MFGLGGVFVEVLGDVTFRVPPFGKDEARRMLDELKGAALLSGARGRPKADLNALADDGWNTRFWVSKLHFYISGLPFYNFPYMFGLLFGLGLYARYQQDPTGFKTGYDELLASTGAADAATLAARLEIDTRSPAFWRASLDTIRADIDRFEALAE